MTVIWLLPVMRKNLKQWSFYSRFVPKMGVWCNRYTNKHKKDDRINEIKINFNPRLSGERGVYPVKNVVSICETDFK